MELMLDVDAQRSGFWWALPVGERLHDSNEVDRQAIPVVVTERHSVAIGTKLAP